MAPDLDILPSQFEIVSTVIYELWESGSGLFR